MKWPKGMSIFIITDDEDLSRLMYVRDCLSLVVEGDLCPPPLAALAETDMVYQTKRLAEDWGGTWYWLWLNALKKAAIFSMRTDESEGQDWRSRFERQFDNTYISWHSRYERLGYWVLGPAREDPEDKCLEATFNAWKRGLRTVVTLPATGHYRLVLDRETMVVSDHTRSEVALYDEALCSFDPTLRIFD